jgi:hypothetical protein
LAWGQGQQDTLFLKNGLKYEGNFEKIEKDTIWFIPIDAFSAQPIEIIKIKKLELYDGTKIINNGILIDIHQVAIDAEKKIVNLHPSVQLLSEVVAEGVYLVCLVSALCQILVFWPYY